MRIHEFTAAISNKCRLMESKSVLIRKKIKRVKMMKMLQFHSRCKRFTMEEDYVLLLKEIHFFLYVQMNDDDLNTEQNIILWNTPYITFWVFELGIVSVLWACSYFKIHYIINGRIKSIKDLSQYYTLWTWIRCLYFKQKFLYFNTKKLFHKEICSHGSQKWMKNLMKI